MNPTMIKNKIMIMIMIMIKKVEEGKLKAGGEKQISRPA